MSQGPLVTPGAGAAGGDIGPVQTLVLVHVPPPESTSPPDLIVQPNPQMAKSATSEISFPSLLLIKEYPRVVLSRDRGSCYGNFPRDLPVAAGAAHNRRR